MPTTRLGARARTAMPRHNAGVGRGSVALSIASHNVQGLNTTKLRALTQAWQRNGHDIVLLQETHITPAAVAALVALLAGWAAYWAHGTQRSAGVAILVRANLLSGASGPLSIADCHPAEDGRSLDLRLGWAGHRMRLVNVYLPNEAAHQRAFIAARLLPLAAAAQASREDLLLGGDFNIVPDVRLDRLPPCTTTAASHPDSRTQQHFTDVLPSLVDIWRSCHPNTRHFTRFGPGTAARLDCFVVSSALANFVGALPTTAVSGHVSDHRLLAVSVRPKAPLPEPPQEQRRRVRIKFSSDPALRAEFLAAVGALAATAPLHPAQLVHWWGRFKHEVFLLCLRLNRTQRAQHHHACEGATAGLDAAYRRADSGVAGAIADVQSARATLAEAEAAERAASELSARRAWLHDGERASPALTARLRPPVSPTIPAVRTTAGNLVTSAQACADTMVGHWAAVSAAQPRDGQAQGAVLAALGEAPQVSPAAAAALSTAEVPASEVAKAMRRARSGTATGPDGLPVEVYRRFPSVFLPLLARVFQAILQHAFLPPHFQDGLIVFLSKPGDASNPASYRPITLLNADYRCFARLLALRLGPALGQVIDGQQTAFLPGRSIWENLLLLQLLPHALRAEQRSALAIFCDFQKAYDTVNRAFLWRIMGQLGIGGPFLRAVQALNSHTYARGCVRGALSRAVRFSAGVWQGCPLAPCFTCSSGRRRAGS